MAYVLQVISQAGGRYGIYTTEGHRAESGVYSILTKLNGSTNLYHHGLKDIPDNQI